MSLIKNAVIDELRAAMALSKEFKEKIDGAKTDIKRKTYKKKLKKNNEIVADLVMALDKLEKRDYNTPDNDS